MAMRPIVFDHLICMFFVGKSIFVPMREDNRSLDIGGEGLPRLLTTLAGFARAAKFPGASLKMKG